MYSPTNSAIGIVQAIVKVPQEEPGMTRAASASEGFAGLGLSSTTAPSRTSSGVGLLSWNASEIGIVDLPPL